MSFFLLRVVHNAHSWLIGCMRCDEKSEHKTDWPMTQKPDYRRNPKRTSMPQVCRFSPHTFWDKSRQSDACFCHSKRGSNKVWHTCLALCLTLCAVTQRTLVRFRRERIALGLCVLLSVLLIRFWVTLKMKSPSFNHLKILIFRFLIIFLDNSD